MSETKISNEQLYQELRKTQRRMLAAVVSVHVVIGYSIGLYILYGNSWIVVVPSAAFVVGLTIMIDYLKVGRFRRILKRFSIYKSEPELADELGDPYEGTTDQPTTDGGLRDLFIRGNK